MRIMHLVTRLLRAGSEENTIATCRWQAQAGHRVTLVFGRDADPWWQNNPVPGVQLVQVPDLVHAPDPVADFAALSALRSLYRRHCPDVIHTHQSKAGILGRFAAGAAPRAVVAHGIHIVPFENVGAIRRAGYIAAERLAARRTDVFIGVSDAVGRAYVDAGIVRRGRVHCVRSGFDLDRFRNARPPSDRNQLVGQLRCGRTPRTVLMLAAFEPRKRHEPFLRAFARAAESLPALRLLLAGSGPCEARLREVVTGLGLQNQVVFCGHRPDPEALLAMADLSVLASEREGLPRVAVQSVAAGCPMVLSDLPGIGEIIAPGHNGQIVAGHDLDGLWAQIGALLHDDLTLQRLRAGARQTDVSDWDIQQMGRRTTALYGLPAEDPQRSVAAA